jgi:ribosomal protein S12 methylthiotransferase
MRARVGFVSLGCSKNLVDTETMIARLQQSDVMVSGNEKEADIVVINTCGFLEPAKEESMSTIGEFIERKKAGSLKAVVVAGCMTERYLELMAKSYPEVDAFIRTGEFSKITEIVQRISAGKKPRVHLVGEEPQLAGHSELPDRIQRLSVKRPYAYVKIAEGCNRTCSFCIIPKLRGKLHSRSEEGVVEEIRDLARLGTKEIILIAQDLTSYGRDRKDGASLVGLVREISKVEGIEWFRLMYNYPRFFTNELVDALAEAPNFSGYLDIPFQHMSDRVLRAMKRPESALEIRELVSKLRTKLPRLSLRTTLMVGFPGETDADFKELMDFVSEGQIDHFGVFTFYREPNTPAFDLPDQVDEEVKKERMHQLMMAQKKILRKKLSDLWVGSETQVMVDGLGESTRHGQVYRARHWGQAPEIDGVTYVVSDEPLEIGTFINVQVEKRVGDYDLLSTPIALKTQKALSGRSRRG